MLQRLSMNTYPRKCSECEFVAQNYQQFGGHRTKHALQFDSVRGDGTRKLRLLEERGHRCESCGGEMWLGSKIPLELDHISGDSDDNRRENLRLLCPNCHAMQDTSHGKNAGKFPYAKRSLGRAKYYKRASDLG
jgi:5-methylcytosine-specific restriction endonuclease McrA